MALVFSRGLAQEDITWVCNPPSEYRARNPDAPLSRALDTGASRLIAEGKIKLKNDSEIECFTPTGLKFKDGSELPADVVIFATGLSLTHCFTHWDG